MRRLSALCMVLVMAGCGSQSSSQAPTPTRTPRSVSAPAPTPTITKTRPKTAPKGPAPVPPAKPTRTFLEFRDNLCRAISDGNSGVVVGLLPYYQYNSGVRYGHFGDGEGQTGDPSLISSWLQPHRAHCRYYTPDRAGHALVLADGWTVPGGPWAIVEADIFNGQWKINDFTFGNREDLLRAMHVMRPVLRAPAT